MSKILNYYTPKNLSDFLIEQVDLNNPKKIIDICAGSWNLLNSAKKRWPNAELTGVDIDDLSKKSVIEDGRRFAFEANSKHQKYDLVLANPPFEGEYINTGIKKLFVEKFGVSFFDGNIYKRLESTMMICNSMIVKKGGILAAIVPLSIINSHSQNSLRAFLSESFYLEKIIKLPSNAFGKKDINTAIILLKKIDETKQTKVYRANLTDLNYKLEYEHELSINDIKNGVWYKKINFTTVKGLSRFVKVFRNNIPSNCFSLSKKGETLNIIHSSSIDKNGVNFENLRYVDPLKLSIRPIYTQKGDILIVRVGRNCGKFTIINSEIGLMTSDCLLVVRIENQEKRGRFIQFLESKEIEAIKKGLTTKYITKKDLIANLL